MFKDTDELRLSVQNGELTIKISLELLAFAVTHAPQWPEKYFVDDLEKFGESMIIALGQEEEDGTNAIHRMFDEAADYALNQGYDGFAEVVEEEELNDAT